MFAFTGLLLTTLFAAANNLTVAPAAVEVPIDSAASGVDYFPFEARQLTDEVLANLTALNLTGASQFGFDNATAAAAVTKGGGTCKAFPGHAEWPSAVEWLVLDLLLGGALIKGVPVAAPCFSDWPQYDTAKCAEITADWQLPPFQ